MSAVPPCLPSAPCLQTRVLTTLDLNRVTLSRISLLCIRAVCARYQFRDALFQGFKVFNDYFLIGYRSCPQLERMQSSSSDPSKRGLRGVVLECF